MPNKSTKLVTATAFTLALAGGGLAGAALGVPSVSGAQTTDDTTTDDTTTDDTTAPPDGFRGPRGRGGPMMGHKLETAAEALGVSVEDLRTAIAGGQTIAEVAAANGVDVQSVIDALVAEATERITDFVNNGPPERPADAPADADAS